MNTLRVVLTSGLVLASLSLVQGDPPNGISAVVHDSVITFDEVDFATAQTAEVLSRQFQNKPDQFQKKMSEARSDNLDKLLARQLILHDFKVAGYNLPESVVDEIVQERIRARYGDRRTLTMTLQHEGMTYEKFRQQVRDQFIIEALRQKNISSEKIIISPHKIESYYQEHKDDFKMENEVKLRMIVLNKSIDPDKPDARKLGEEIAAKLKEGATFEEMATIYSQRAQKNAGGEWFETSKLRKELAEASAKLKAGEQSELIDTPEACYFLRVEESRPARFKSLTEVRPDIEKDLETQERARLEKQWIERLRKKTFIRYFQ